MLNFQIAFVLVTSDNKKTIFKINADFDVKCCIPINQQLIILFCL
jgi:hypothetical protein